MARITWLTAEQGGRAVPFDGERYIVPARFLAAWEAWENGAWSLVVTKMKSGEAANEWIAEVHFPVQEAPHELLAEGGEFELYEGKKCTARGVCLAPTIGESNGLAINMQREKKRN